jgi:hypothetical protein
MMKVMEVMKVTDMMEVMEIMEMKKMGMKKIRNKAMVFLLCAVLLFVLTGCSLAREDMGTNPARDKLVGVFLTAEYLDLFDFDNYLNDNAGNLTGGKIVMGGNTQEYQGRIYATIVAKKSTSETGEIGVKEEYVFEGIEGVAYLYIVIVKPTADGQDSVRSVFTDEEIGEHIADCYYSDDEDRASLEGTIYISPEGLRHVYYYNPVYQSADGSIYMVTGPGMETSIESVEGELFGWTLGETYTETENGKTKKESISIKLSVSLVPDPEKIVILQMDAESKIISRTEYQPGTLPESITPEKGAAYVLVETYTKGERGEIEREGESRVARDIYGRDSESLSTFLARADGFCIKYGTKINWIC